MTVEIIESEQCCGCAACVDRCPVHAIDMTIDLNGTRRPSVNQTKCVDCGLCVKTCPQLSPMNDDTGKAFLKQSFVGFYNNIVAHNSASGGIFIAIADYFIKELGGIVYGAMMSFEDNELKCRHARVDDVKDLHLLQGSKYVQSKTDGIYSLVKSDLNKGKLCLFSGTSCQVAALKKIVGNHQNLFTIDLVCHGVPKDSIFDSYIRFVENRKKCKIVDVSFRKKGIKINGKEDTYILSFKCKKENGELFDMTVPKGKSPFFRLFINRAGYRTSCYNCLYATIYKPSDITLGDFCPDEEEVVNYNFSHQNHYSTIIVHTTRGLKLLEDVSNECLLVKFPQDIIIRHHHNLQYSSEITEEGKKLMAVYEDHGYYKLQKIVDVDYMKERVKYLLNKLSRVFCFNR